MYQSVGAVFGYSLDIYFMCFLPRGKVLPLPRFSVDESPDIRLRHRQHSRRRLSASCPRMLWVCSSAFLPLCLTCFENIEQFLKRFSLDPEFAFELLTR